LWGRKTIKNAAAIHFTTDEERRKAFAIEALFKTIPHFIIPNGVEIKALNTFRNIRKDLRISDEKFILLFIGRIHRVKGIHIIFEALKKLNDENFLFLIVGHKEDEGYTKHLTHLAKDLRSKVIFHPSVPNDIVWDFNYSSNLFVLPSYSENFSNVIIEAMVCGLPVLITKHVGIWREVQADASGFIVNQDADEIAKILKNLPQDTETLRTISKNAKKSAENRFDINKIAYLMIKAYDDILRKIKP
jgi:glycosyltransferase involved in cell wall biosynthesis